jgi:hypothetical protein
MAIERGQCVVSGADAVGNPALVDVLDLEEASFRAFVLEHLARGGLVKPRDGWQATGCPITYQARLGAKVEKG